MQNKLIYLAVFSVSLLSAMEHDLPNALASFQEGSKLKKSGSFSEDYGTVSLDGQEIVNVDDILGGEGLIEEENLPDMIEYLAALKCSTSLTHVPAEIHNKHIEEVLQKHKTKNPLKFKSLVSEVARSKKQEGVISADQKRDIAIGVSVGPSDLQSPIEFILKRVIKKDLHFLGHEVSKERAQKHIACGISFVICGALLGLTTYFGTSGNCC